MIRMDRKGNRVHGWVRSATVQDPVTTHACAHLRAATCAQYVHMHTHMLYLYVHAMFVHTCVSRERHYGWIDGKKLTDI